MQVTARSIAFEKPELRALLAFASREDSDLASVAFTIGGGSAKVYATDSVRALEADSPAPESLTAEWYVQRPANVPADGGAGRASENPQDSRDRALLAGAYARVPVWHRARAAGSVVNTGRASSGPYR